MTHPKHLITSHIYQRLRSLCDCHCTLITALCSLNIFIVFVITLAVMPQLCSTQPSYIECHHSFYTLVLLLQPLKFFGNW